MFLLYKRRHFVYNIKKSRWGKGEKTTMQRLEGLMRKALQSYQMIAPGDRVLVGVSGGKDSVALAVGLARLRAYYEAPFTLVALSLDAQFDGRPTDYTPLQQLFAEYEVPYEVRRTEIGRIVFADRQEKNPCALCAKMRRGALHEAARALGCNKVALGHHLDDAIETFYMNLWGEGRLGCFSPKTWLSRRQLTCIRPMVLATEAEVAHAVRSLGLPVVKNPCPVDGTTRRQQMKEYVHTMVHQDPAFRQKMLGALQKADLDGWGPAAVERRRTPPSE